MCSMRSNKKLSPKVAGLRGVFEWDAILGRAAQTTRSFRSNQGPRIRNGRTIAYSHFNGSPLVTNSESNGHKESKVSILRKQKSAAEYFISVIVP